MQEEGAADESLEPRSVGARVPAALRQQQRTQTVASEVATATALPGTAPKARRSVAVDHEEGEEDLSSAREQLRHLVGQLREAVAEDPVSMEARLREQHGFVFT